MPAWLHLSDWHQKVTADFDRGVVLRALLDDVENRRGIDPRLAEIDFLIFSGDLAFAGAEEEFQEAEQQLILPVLERLELDRSRVLIVPGNHDVDRGRLELLPAAVTHAFGDEAQLKHWLTDDERRSTLLQPLAAYRAFAARYGLVGDPGYATVRRAEVGGLDVAIAGLDSAFMARGVKVAGGEEDYGLLSVGEPQVVDALAGLADADVRIGVLHHPSRWLRLFDQRQVDELLAGGCDFVLHGHQHEPGVNVLQGDGGAYVRILAGASYDRRNADDQRFVNSYNFVHLDVEGGRFFSFVRHWSERRRRWTADVESAPTDGVADFPLPPRVLERWAHKTGGSAAAPAGADAAEASDQSAVRRALDEYLNALIRGNSDLDPRGIGQTTDVRALPLERVYLHLRAIRDQPDVDRRYQQAELDADRQDAENEPDPQRRDQALDRIAHVESRLKLSERPAGEAHALHDIVNRHRSSVVLGDPGSGKTTFVRYLALMHARALRENPDYVLRPPPATHSEARLIEGVGPLRLPILMRVSLFAEARKEDRNLALVDYLPRYFRGLQVPGAEHLGPLFVRMLAEGRCLVLLDGLDEIVDDQDRRSIADAVGQFIANFASMGLEAADEPSERVGIDESLLPEDARVALREEHMRRKRLEKRLGHLGNRFVVTSRIAGYHPARVPGDVELYTIRDMDRDEIATFLERYSLTLERQVATDPDTVEPEAAQQEAESVLAAIDATPGVKRLASNPLLLHILLLVHRTGARLPARRVELYEAAARTLLFNWNIAKGPGRAPISETEALRMLGPLAFHIHEELVTNTIPLADAQRFLARERARDEGEDPDNPSLRTELAVREFLEQVRQTSGIFVERGTRLYGFMHLTFQEYFAARELVRSSARARSLILERLHLPRWREPILLAIGTMSGGLYDDAEALIRAIRDSPSAHEELLHRNLLFVAHCIGDTVQVSRGLRREVAQSLLAVWCDVGGRGRYSVLRDQIIDALRVLIAGEGRISVEDAIADALLETRAPEEQDALFEVIESLAAGGDSIADALQACATAGRALRGRRLLATVAERRARDDGEGASRWQPARDSAAAARVLGLLAGGGWNVPLTQALALETEAAERCARGAAAIADAWSVAGGQAILGMIDQARPDDDRALVEIRDRLRLLPRRSALGFAAVSAARAIEDRDGHPDRERVAKATARFRAQVARSQRDVRGDGVAELRLRYGLLMLRAAAGSGFLGEHLIAIGDEIGESRLATHDADGEVLDEVRSALRERLLRLLATPQDDVDLADAVHLLLDTSDGPAADVSQAVATMLARPGEPRRQALLLLDQPMTRTGLMAAIDDAHVPLLLEEARGAPEEARIALLALFERPVRAEVVAAYWSFAKRASADALHEVSRQARARVLAGGDEVLAIVDEGLGDDDLRPLAHELLRNLRCRDHQTLRWVLRWAQRGDPIARLLAARALVERADPYADVRAALTRDEPSETHDDADPGGWLKRVEEDDGLVRLLALLWRHGWQTGLEHLLRETDSADRSLATTARLDESITTQLQAERLVITRLRAAAAREAAAPQGVLMALEAAADRLAAYEGDDEAYTERALGDVVAPLYAAAAVDPAVAAILPIAQLRALASQPGPADGWVARALSTDRPPEADLFALAGDLGSRDPDARRSAALRLVQADLLVVIAPPLLETIGAEDDQTRVTAQRALTRLGTALSGDPTSAAVALLREHRRACAGSGSAVTMVGSALSRIYHGTIETYAESLGESAGGASPAAIAAAHARMRDPAQPLESRVDAIAGVAHVASESTGFYSAATGSTLMDLLGDEEGDVRVAAASSLRWVPDGQLPEALERLLTFAAERVDERGASIALMTSGQLIARGHALAGKGPPLRPSMSPPLNELERRAVDLEADKALSDSERRDPRARRTLALFAAHRRDRGALTERIPDICARVSQLRDLTDDPSPMIAAATRAALASALRHLPPSAFAAVVGDIPATLRALVAGASAVGTFDSERRQEVERIATWVHGLPRGPRAECFDMLLGWLAESLELPNDDREHPLGDATPTLGLSLGWPVRRTVVAVLMALSEQSTYHSFTHTRPLEEVIRLFTKAAEDLSSFNARRFALTTLGNLQHLNAEVAAALRTACRDVRSVTDDLPRIIPRFRSFTEEGLRELARSADDPSAAAARNAVLLLAALGTSRSEEIGAGGRELIADELAKLLATDSATRAVYDTTATPPREAGYLYDDIFDAIVRVVDPNAVVPSRTPVGAGDSAEFERMLDQLESR